MKKFLLSIRNVLVTVIILYIGFTFILGLKMAPNDDMKPRVSAGDILLYYRIDKIVNSGDVILVRKNGTDYIGRVVAKGGDKVDISEKTGLIINDIPIVEENIYYETPQYEGFVKYPVTLGSDECFVLSDKRDGGEDSRYYGPVKKDEILGTVIGQFRRVGI